MKLFSTTIFFCFWAVCSFAQFEAGYFIDNDGKRTDCLIRNLDWRNNPVQIDWKSGESEPVTTKDIGNITEFGIGNQLRYVRYMEWTSIVLRTMFQK